MDNLKIQLVVVIFCALVQTSQALSSGVDEEVELSPDWQVSIRDRTFLWQRRKHFVIHSRYFFHFPAIRNQKYVFLFWVSRWRRFWPVRWPIWWKDLKLFASTDWWGNAQVARLTFLQNNCGQFSAVFSLYCKHISNLGFILSRRSKDTFQSKQTCVRKMIKIMYFMPPSM